MAINIDELNDIMDNDAELIRECFDDFMAEYHELIQDVRSAVKACDYEAINDNAHKIKGVLKYLAAGPAADAALALEQAGRNRDQEKLDQKMADLDFQCRKVFNFIQAFPK